MCVREKERKGVLFDWADVPETHTEEIVDSRQRGKDSRFFKFYIHLVIQFLPNNTGQTQHYCFLHTKTKQNKLSFSFFFFYPTGVCGKKSLVAWREGTLRRRTGPSARLKNSKGTKQNVPTTSNKMTPSFSLSLATTGQFGG